MSKKQDKNKSSKSNVKSQANATVQVFNTHCQMAKRLGETFISPLYDKNNSTNKNASSPSIKTDLTISYANKTKSEKKSTLSTSFKTTELSSYDNDENENSDGMQSFSKKRTTLKEEIDIKQNFEQNIPNYYTRKEYDLMRIVEDQVILFKM
jgi:hypothetical protein